MCVVTRIKGVILRKSGSIPSKGKRIPVLQTMQMGYGAQRACYSMGVEGKAAKARR